jgi:hypothetical protein
MNSPVKFGQKDQDSLLSAPANRKVRKKARRAATAIRSGPGGVAPDPGDARLFSDA